MKVVCPPRVTISGGLGVAGLQERNFLFVNSLPDPPDPMADPPGSGDDGSGGDDGNGDDDDDGDDDPAVVQRFASDRTSDYELGPTTLVHLRLNRRPLLGSLAADLHFTAGTFFDLDDPKSTVGIGYAAGLSLSMAKGYVTAGVIVGRETSLAGGFEEGDLKPAGDALATPETISSWETTWFLGLTYQLGGGG